MIPLVRRAATTLLRSSTVNRAVRALARFRGHRLVLVYHRLGPSVPTAVVPTVPVDVFRTHLHALREAVDLVSIDEVLAPASRGSTVERSRPAVALTFDDDLPSHVEHVLPVLRELDVPATFFLSGRTLQGLGAYWFQHLEALLLHFGEQRTATLLDLPDLPVERVMIACETDPDLRARVMERAAGLPAPEILDRAAIAALGRAGMSVGFHTVAHDVLPNLENGTLERAVSEGREALSAAAGVPVRYFAYPHGKVDARSAAAVKRARFDAAFTGQARPLRRADDVYRVGRWEPGSIDAGSLLVKLAMRLHTAAPPGGTISS